MTKIILAILISPCISMASQDIGARTTEIYACPNTVKIESRTMIRQMKYGRYQDNFFRLRKIMFAKK